jgi:quinol monooxygenase YgiN
MMLVVATYQVAVGEIDATVLLVEELARHSRQEPGCRSYTVARSREDPSRIVLVERYDDDAAFQAHLDSPHYQRIGKGLIRPLLESRAVELLDPFGEGSG